jgi:hypothetical protein
MRPNALVPLALSYSGVSIAHHGTNGHDALYQWPVVRKNSSRGFGRTCNIVTSCSALSNSCS